MRIRVIFKQIDVLKTIIVCFLIERIGVDVNQKYTGTQKNLLNGLRKTYIVRDHRQIMVNSAA